jgi:WD40 repeat protein
MHLPSRYTAAIRRPLTPALALLALLLVACTPGPSIRPAALPSGEVPSPIAGPSPPATFTYQELAPTPAHAPADTRSWPRDPGDNQLPTEPPVIGPGNAGHLRPVQRLGLGTPTALALDPSGQRLAVAGGSGLVSIYSVPRGVVRERWQAGDRQIKALAFNADGTRLITAGAGGQVSIWDSAGARPIAEFDTGVRDPHQVSVSASGSGPIVAILTHDPLANRSEVTVWDAAGGLLLQRHASAFPVTALAVSRDGDAFALGASDGAVELYAVADGDLIAVESLHSGSVQALAIVDADRPRYVSAGPGRTRLRGYDLPEALTTWDSPNRIAAITTAGTGLVLSGDFGGRLTLTDPRDATVQRIAGVHHDRIVALSLDAAGAVAASASRDGVVVIWSADPSRPGSVVPLLLPGYAPPITGLRFADGGLLAIRPDGSNTLWQDDDRSPSFPATLESVANPAIPGARIASSPSPGMIAIGGPGGRVTLYRHGADSTPVHVFRFAGPITALAFGGAQTLLIVDGNGDLHRTDLTTRVTAPVPAPVPGAVAAVAAGPNSTRIVVALVSADSLGTLALVDLIDGRWTVLDRYSGFINALAASAGVDAIFILRGAVDEAGRLELRDGIHGGLLASLATPSHQPLHLALSPDGRRLATAGASGEIWLWTVTGR